MNELDPTTQEHTLSKLPRPLTLKFLAVFTGLPSIFVVFGPILFVKSGSGLGMLTQVLAAALTIFGLLSLALAVSVWKGSFAGYVISLILAGIGILEAIPTFDVLTLLISVAVIALALAPQTRSYVTERREERKALKIANK